MNLLKNLVKLNIKKSENKMSNKTKNLEIPVAENERNKAVEHLISLKEYFDNQLKSDKETYQAIATLGDKLGVLWNGDK